MFEYFFVAYMMSGQSISYFHVHVSRTPRLLFFIGWPAWSHGNVTCCARIWKRGIDHLTRVVVQSAHWTMLNPIWLLLLLSVLLYHALSEYLFCHYADKSSLSCGRSAHKNTTTTRTLANKDASIELFFFSLSQTHTQDTNTNPP